MRKSFAGLAALALLLWCAPASAVSISLVPSSAVVGIGGFVTVDVVISGLGAGTPPTLSGFDLDVSFAAPPLSFAGTTFGTGLGSGAGQVLTASALLPGPAVYVSAASFLGSATLDAQQPGTFVLATLTFQAVALGTSPLAIADALLADTSAVPGGNEIPVDSVVGTSIDVVVPEPASALLLGVGLAALSGLRRREDRR